MIMNIEKERVWKEDIVACLKVLSLICLERLRKITER
jgi:hypothetical protein